MAIFEKRGKVWRFRVRKKQNGKVVFDYTGSGYDTKRAAEFAAKQIEIDYEKGFIKDDGNSSFADYFEKWIKLYKIESGKHRTNSFRQTAIKRCHELFGTVKIKNVSRDYYQNIINELGTNLARATVKKYHQYFKACFDHALEERVIHTNPATKIVLKGNASKTKKASEKFLNYTEAIKLKNALLDSEYDVSNLGRNCAVIALETGMRFGEILGLTKDRIDLEKNQITIDRSFDYLFTNKLTTTKTDNERTISISDFLVTFLKNIMDAFPDNEFIIANNFQNHISNNGANSALEAACERSGIKRITMHNLRHTHGSILLYKGYSILYISKRLGHANVTITQEVYLHILDELQEQEDKKIKDGLF